MRSPPDYVALPHSFDYGIPELDAWELSWINRPFLYAAGDVDHRAVDFAIPLKAQWEEFIGQA